MAVVRGWGQDAGYGPGSSTCDSCLEEIWSGVVTKYQRPYSGDDAYQLNQWRWWSFASKYTGIHHSYHPKPPFRTFPYPSLSPRQAPPKPHNSSQSAKITNTQSTISQQASAGGGSTFEMRNPHDGWVNGGEGVEVAKPSVLCKRTASFPVHRSC